jgi:LPS-assembly lipoprotein
MNMHKRWLLGMTGCGLLLALTACGFHLRRGAQLPPGMQRIHLTVRSGGDLQRQIARELEVSGATLVDAPGPGVAEMRVPQVRFRTQALTFTGRARVGEYTVRLSLRFQVRDHQGRVIVPMQSIHLSRDFTYDARQPVGTETQTEQLHQSMTTDAVQAIMFRLRAAAEHAGAAPAASVPAPAPATSAATR